MEKARGIRLGPFCVCREKCSLERELERQRRAARFPNRWAKSGDGSTGSAVTAEVRSRREPDPVAEIGVREHGGRGEVGSVVVEEATDTSRVLVERPGAVNAERRRRAFPQSLGQRGEFNRSGHPIERVGLSPIRSKETR